MLRFARSAAKYLSSVYLISIELIISMSDEPPVRVDWLIRRAIR
jgi:hypothetical protein